MKVPGQLAHSHSHKPTHFDSGHHSLYSEAGSQGLFPRGTVSCEGGKMLANHPSGEEWIGTDCLTGVSLELSGFVPRASCSQVLVFG